MDIGRRLQRLIGVGSPSQPESSTGESAGGRSARSESVHDGSVRGESVHDGSTASAEQSTEGWLASTDRSQSEVLGTVLILGLSMTAIGIALVGGGVAVGDLMSDAEASNVENGMSHLSSKASLVALGDADSQRFSLGSTQEGTVSVQPDEGTMTITNVTNESREVINETTLGAIVYEGKNREVAYQGGGIWTKRGDNSTMTSPPEYHYRERTLTLPIVQVSGEGATGGRTQGQITPVETGHDVVEGLPTPLEEGVIEIKIQSEYYEGWYRFLSERTAGETELFHSNKTVVSTLTVPDELTVDHSLSVQTSYDASGNAEIEEPVRENVPHRSAGPLIDTRAQEAAETGTDWSDADDPLTAGTYYHDGDLTLDENLDIDTSDGNVTIVVDGTFDIQNYNVSITDTDTNNTVEYYVNGALRAQGNAYVGTAESTPRPERNVFYVAEGFLDESTGGGTTTFEAIVYAPDADVDVSGTAHINGSIVANRLDVGGSFELEYYNPGAGNEVTLELTGAADLLRYLHVSRNEIRVELD